MANQLEWVVGAGLPDLLFQDFESGVIPSRWVTVTAPVNYAFVPPITGYGTFSLGLTSAVNSEAYGAFPGTGEVFFFFVMFLSTLPNPGSKLLSLYTSGNTTEQFRITLTGTGFVPPSVLAITDLGGAHIVNGVTPLTINTNWFVWGHYIAGTGANATLTVGYNTVLVEPTSGNSFVSITNGASTGRVSSIDFEALTANTVIDHVGVSTFDMPTGW